MGPTKANDSRPKMPRELRDRMQTRFDALPASERRTGVILADWHIIPRQLRAVGGGKSTGCSSTDRHDRTLRTRSTGWLQSSPNAGRSTPGLEHWAPLRRQPLTALAIGVEERPRVARMLRRYSSRRASSTRTSPEAVGGASGYDRIAGISEQLREAPTTIYRLSPASHVATHGCQSRRSRTWPWRPVRGARIGRTNSCVWSGTIASAALVMSMAGRRSGDSRYLPECVEFRYLAPPLRYVSSRMPSSDLFRKGGISSRR